MAIRKRALALLLLAGFATAQRLPLKIYCDSRALLWFCTDGGLASPSKREPGVAHVQRDPARRSESARQGSHGGLPNDFSGQRLIADLDSTGINHPLFQVIGDPLATTTATPEPSM